MRFLFAFRAFDDVAGGVQRMMAVIMNDLVSKGHEIHLYTIDNEKPGSYYKLDPAIRWHKLNMGDYREKASLSLKIKRALVSRKLIKDIKPDLIIGFQDGAFLTMRAYSVGLNIPVILAERIAPSHFDHTSSGKHKKLRQQTYRLAEKITIQCKSYKNEYPSYLRPKLVTIPNPVFPSQSSAKPQGVIGQRKNLLCVGRLCYQKNQSLLIRCFSELCHDFPDWHLVLAGGDRVDDMRDLIQQLGISERVDLLGEVKNVENLYKKAHLYCLPSRWEGFPNSLAEALAHGVPSVGFAGCGGVRDLIIDEKNGLLAQGNNNEATLKDALSVMMEDKADRATMGQCAMKSIEPYEPSEILKQWERFLIETASRYPACSQTP